MALRSRARRRRYDGSRHVMRTAVRPAVVHAPSVVMEPAGSTRTVAAQAASPALHGMFSSSASATASREVVVPPLNFDMVAAGVYRSGHPNERNFSFLRRLNLKSIVYLATDDYRQNMAEFARAEGLRVFHHRVNMNKEPFTEMDEGEVASALEHVLDKRNLPVLVHCNKGKYRVGCLVGCLRRLQGWSHTSILEEYARFAGDKIADEEVRHPARAPQLTAVYRGV